MATGAETVPVQRVEGAQSAWGAQAVPMGASGNPHEESASHCGAAQGMEEAVVGLKQLMTDSGSGQRSNLSRSNNHSNRKAWN